MNIEIFFENYKYTFSAIGSIATVFVVWLALNQHRTKIKAIFEVTNLAILFPSNDKTVDIEYISISVTNKGLLPVFVSGIFTLRFPFNERLNINLTPAKEENPFRIEPRKSKKFEIEYHKGSNFYDKLEEVKKEVGKFSFYFLCGEIRTDDGTTFRVKNTNKVIKSILNKTKP